MKNSQHSNYVKSHLVSSHDVMWPCSHPQGCLQASRASYLHFIGAFWNWSTSLLKEGRLGKKVQVNPQMGCKAAAVLKLHVVLLPFFFLLLSAFAKLLTSLPPGNCWIWATRSRKSLLNLGMTTARIQTRYFWENTCDIIMILLFA